MALGTIGVARDILGSQAPPISVWLCLVAVDCDIHHAEQFPWLHQCLSNYTNILLHGSTSSTCLLVTLCICLLAVKNLYTIFSNHFERMIMYLATEHHGHKRLLNRDDLNYLKSILHAETGLFLDEVQEKLCIV